MKPASPLWPVLAVMLVIQSTAVLAVDMASGAAAVAPYQPFADSDLLWMEVRAGERQLAESMDVYSSRAGVFVPLGQFSRILDLAITVLPPERRAEGWILSRQRGLVLDLAKHTATIGGHAFAFDAGEAVLYKDDIYLRIDLAEKLLPVKLRPDPAAQLLLVIPTEPLPFEQKAERAQRRTDLSPVSSEGGAVAVSLPYSGFSQPAFDVTVGGQAARAKSDQSRQYNVRAASDLAYAGFRGFAGSDADGHINDVRVLLERKSTDGHALGTLGGARAAMGDVFTPSSALGAASAGGRGLFYSSAPLETVDLSTPVNLRGEMQLGEEVELYVNETLRASQSTPVQGRYEFMNVPLSLGMNVIRLVFYGSQGQRREQVRRINLGAGQIEAGQLVLRLGAVQQDRAVIQIARPTASSAGGALRAVAAADYGISSQLTASAGVSRYSPLDAAARFVGLAGLRGSLAGAAAQGDLAIDDRGGFGVTLGLAARPYGISILAHHSEYAGGFVDETRQFAVTEDLALRRASDLRADTSFRVGKSVSIPMSFDLRRFERSDGSVMTSWSARASAPVRAFYVSTSLSDNIDTLAPGGRNQLEVNFDAATLVAKRFQLRAGLAYRVRPNREIESLFAVADLQLSATNSLHLGITRSGGPHAETSLQASHLYHSSRFDIAPNASCDLPSRQWRFGLQIAFSLAPDPLTHRYAVARPGASAGGAVVVDAFVDANGDGVRQPEEAPVRGIIIETPAGAIATSVQGRAGIGGLGDSGKVVMRVDSEKIDDPFLTGAPQAYEIVPRPGRVTRIEIPMRQSAEVEVVVMLRGLDGSKRLLSALNIELVSAGGSGAPAGARTDHAGVAIFEDVRPGDYLVRLQPAQADELGLSQDKPVNLAVPAAGGYIRAGEVLVDIRQATTR